MDSHGAPYLDPRGDIGTTWSWGNAAAAISDTGTMMIVWEIFDNRLMGRCYRWPLAGSIFRDGFEPGDTSAWSETVP